MADGGEPNAVRKPRADAQRNRMRVLDAAKRAFATKGAATNLDEIAREAGVGIGTLYRHFPTRDALVQAVYLNETRQLAEAAATFSSTDAPVPALRAWMLAFVDYIATKQVMADMLQSLPGGTSDLYGLSTTQITSAIKSLVDRAVAAGEIELGMDPLDVLRALSGVAYANAESARRMVDILVAGVRR